ncbi:MAG: serine/threonine-protein kinase [Candidatus Zixiibacteriota bacterium]
MGEAIGEGGQKKVYRCIHPLHGESVLKLIPSHTSMRDERARREIQIAEMLEGPFFLKVFAVGDVSTSQGPSIFVLEEYFDGRTLRQVLNDAGDHRLRSSEVRRIIGSVLRALLVIEEKKLVHRDIKPENVMVSDTRVVVIDFGIARNLDMISATNTVAPIGPMTIGYGAPEQIRNEKRKISICADIFSVGVLTFEMVTGFSPFRSGCGTVEEVVDRTLHANPLTNTEHGLSQSLENFIGRCMEKNSHRRPQSAAMALELFESILWEN